LAVARATGARRKAPAANMARLEMDGDIRMLTGL
jgi:hypothetical protein